MRLPIAVLALAVLPAALQAQSFEGSKWSVEQEGVETPAFWWFGSQGRVRTGDVGTILPGYKWRQAGDSIFVSVGDTVRYTGQLISNRFVGIRTGPRSQEGWWSGSRATAAIPAATNAPKPANTGASTETMSRPIEPTGNASTAAPAPRTLQRIERSDGGAAPSSAAPAGGQEIRRIQRTNTLPSTTDPDLVPHWGNRIDTHVHVLPGRRYDGTARLSIVGGVDTDEIDAPSGVTLQIAHIA